LPSKWLKNTTDHTVESINNVAVLFSVIATLLKSILLLTLFNTGLVASEVDVNENVALNVLVISDIF